MSNIVNRFAAPKVTTSIYIFEFHPYHF